jgi:hypothetical protein
MDFSPRMYRLKQKRAVQATEELSNVNVNHFLQLTFMVFQKSFRVEKHSVSLSSLKFSLKQSNYVPYS